MTTTMDSLPIGQHVISIETWSPRNASPDDEFEYIDIASVDRDTKSLIGTSHLRADEAPSRARQIVHACDVIVSTVRPNLNAVAVVPDHLTNAIASTGFCVLRCHGAKLDHRYLFHWVRTEQFVADMVRQATGASYPAVSDRIIKESRIPLPPLLEQKRIADILDKADAIQRKRREATEGLSDLIDSQFLTVFGDPLSNPKRWEPGTFDNHLTLVQYGPRFFNESYTTDGIRIVRITDLDQHGNLDYSAMPRMTVSEKDRDSYILRPGDLLLARSGATVGKTALIDDAAPECIAGAYFIRLRFTDKIRPLYAQLVLRSKPVQTIIAENSRQSAQQNFNGPAIRALPLPAPPTALQDKFVEFHRRVIQSGRRFSEATRNVDDLFNSLVQRAFRGDL